MLHKLNNIRSLRALSREFSIDVLEEMLEKLRIVTEEIRTQQQQAAQQQQQMAMLQQGVDMAGGAAMAGDIVADLYYDTLEDCTAFGRRNMNVYVIRAGW